MRGISVNFEIWLRRYAAAGCGGPGRGCPRAAHEASGASGGQILLYLTVPVQHDST